MGYEIGVGAGHDSGTADGEGGEAAGGDKCSLCAEVGSDGFSGTGHDLLHAGEGLAGLVHCSLDSGAKDRSTHYGGGADGVDDLSDAELLIYIEVFFV